jgi:predicted GH43/DUF377 family glycosyl hydrolase
MPAQPVKTPHGWLEIYHGATAEHRYCLGAFLMDLDDPSIVLARSTEPIMVPTERYELSGFLDLWFLLTGISDMVTAQPSIMELPTSSSVEHVFLYRKS